METTFLLKPATDVANDKLVLLTKKKRKGKKVADDDKLVGNYLFALGGESCI